METKIAGYYKGNWDKRKRLRKKNKREEIIKKALVKRTRARMKNELKTNPYRIFLIFYAMYRG